MRWQMSRASSPNWSPSSLSSNRTANCGGQRHPADVAVRRRHALVHTKDEWLPPVHLELELSLEHEEELVFVLVAVPVDELALDHGKSDDGVIHARERLIHPRLIPCALCGDVDLRKLTVLVVISDVVVLHTHLPVALD